MPCAVRCPVTQYAVCRKMLCDARCRVRGPMPSQILLREYEVRGERTLMVTDELLQRSLAPPPRNQPKQQEQWRKAGRQQQQQQQQPLADGGGGEDAAIGDAAAPANAPALEVAGDAPALEVAGADDAADAAAGAPSGNAASNEAIGADMAEGEPGGTPPSPPRLSAVTKGSPLRASPLIHPISAPPRQPGRQNRAQSCNSPIPPRGAWPANYSTQSTSPSANMWLDCKSCCYNTTAA
eukprot:366230-Chlamydomonas_euryale.AAC.11